MTGVDIAFVVGLALAGLVVSSFLNASIVRWVGWRVLLPQLTGEVAETSDLSGSPARCAVCDARLAPWGGGAISWVATLGRCRGPDRHRLATRYLVIDVLVAGLWALAGARFGIEPAVVPVLILVAGLVAMAAVDLWVMRIPNRFVYGTHAVLIPAIVVVSIVDGVPGAIAGAAVGGVAFFGFLLLFHLVSPRRMGFGDVRLAGVMGLVLGWLGWLDDHTDELTTNLDGLWFAVPLAWVIWGALLGSLLGTLAGVASLIGRRRNRPFPFGPALASGTLIIVFAGDQIIG